MAVAFRLHESHETVAQVVLHIRDAKNVLAENARAAADLAAADGEIPFSGEVDSGNRKVVDGNDLHVGFAANTLDIQTSGQGMNLEL
jgi:hypothetical protein